MQVTLASLRRNVSLVSESYLGYLLIGTQVFIIKQIIWKLIYLKFVFSRDVGDVVALIEFESLHSTGNFKVL